MKVILQNLGSDFSMEAINSGNTYGSTVEGNAFSIQPGTYILSKKGIDKTWSPYANWGVNKLNDFYAPETTVKKAWFKHTADGEVSENTPLEISADFIAPVTPLGLQVVGYSDAGRIAIDMERKNGFTYSATIPADKLTAGYLRYYIVVKQKKINTSVILPHRRACLLNGIFTRARLTWCEWCLKNIRFIFLMPKMTLMCSSVNGADPLSLSLQQSREKPSIK